MPPKKRQAVTLGPSPPHPAGLSSTTLQGIACPLSSSPSRNGNRSARKERQPGPASGWGSSAGGAFTSCEAGGRQHAMQEERGTSQSSHGALLSCEKRGNQQWGGSSRPELPPSGESQDVGQFARPLAGHEQRAAAYASSLSTAGLSGLYHPLYERLQCAAPDTRSFAAGSDGRLLQDILELCPLRTPAAVLVESKLSSRALRLDTLRPSLPALTSGGGGDLARKGPSLSAGADHSRTLLKLTRTKAKASGLFDIRRELCGSRQADRRPRSSSLSPPALRSTASRSRDSLSRLRFDELHGLRRLWLQYTENVCGTREASAPVSLKQAISPAAALPRKPPSGVVSETSGRATGETVAESSAEQAQADPSSRQKQPGNGNGRKQRAYDRCTILSKCALQGAQVAVVRARVPGLVGIEGTVVEETQQSLLLLCRDQRLRRLMKNSVVLTVRGSDGSNYFLHGQHLQHNAAGRSKVKLKPKTSLLLKCGRCT